MTCSENGNVLSKRVEGGRTKPRQSSRTGNLLRNSRATYLEETLTQLFSRELGFDMAKNKLPLLRPREGSHIFGGIMLTLLVGMGYYNYKFATTGGLSWGPGPNKLPNVMNGNANNNQTPGTSSSSPPASSSS
jgi:hypothetical protein